MASGGDALVLMPTGGGKSLCYQVPALLRPGVAVVVSPLIALMDDQVATLLELGVSATALNSTMTGEQQRAVAAQLERGEIKLLYLAPERLVQPRMLDFLKRLPIALFAIDEAHCVSSGAMTSARNTCSSVSWPNTFPACRAWRSPPPRIPVPAR